MDARTAVKISGACRVITCIALVVAAALGIVTAMPVGAASALGIVPPANPPQNILPNPNYDNCSGDSCTVGPPCYNSSFEPAFSSPSCVQEQVQAIDNARAAEGVGPLYLPTDYGQLTPAEQVFVVIDLERVGRGLPPFAGLVSSLDSLAETGVNPPGLPPGYWEDPVLPSGFSLGAGTNLAWDCTLQGQYPYDYSVSCPGLGNAGASIAAGGMISPLDADFSWMYNDGWGGSLSSTSNIDCTSPAAQGCWGHRDNILGPYPTSARFVSATSTSSLQVLASPVPATLVMGAAVDNALYDGFPEGNYAAIFLSMTGTPPPFVYSWAQAVAAGAGTGRGVPQDCSLGFYPGTGVALVRAKVGYWIVSSQGQVSSCSGAPAIVAASLPAGAKVTGAASTPSGGLLVTTNLGGVYAYAGARYYGCLEALPAAAQPGSPVVGIAVDPATGGYWQVAADGGVYSFGAPFHGSMGGHPLNAPVVGIAVDPATGGYWLVAADGGVFSFGAPYYGSAA